MSEATLRRVQKDIGEIKEKVTSTETLLKTHIKVFSEADGALRIDVERLRTRQNALEVANATQTTRLEGKIRTMYTLGAFTLGVAAILGMILQFVKV